MTNEKESVSVSSSGSKSPTTKNAPTSQNDDEEMLELMNKFMAYIQVADMTQLGSPYAQEALDVFKQLVEGV